jgi:uroporphyrinogen decarboxylase
MMTAKERTVAAIEFSFPDRAPVKFDVPDWEGYLREFQPEYPTDIIHSAPGWYVEGCLPGENIDNWGCKWTNLIAPALGQVTGHPLGDISNLSYYKPPDPMDLDLTAAIRISHNRQDKYLLLGYIPLFERLINLRGFEDLLVDMISDRDSFLMMRDMVHGYNMRLVNRLLGLRPDGISLADDWGSQISLLISPDLWRELFKPLYKEMISKIKAAGVHVFFHSDGYIMDILPDFIEIGVDVFWVEFGVNPINKLKEAAKNKAAFLALYDTQKVERSSLEELEIHLNQCRDIFGGKDGGFIGLYDLNDSKANTLIRENWINYVKGKL